MLKKASYLEICGMFFLNIKHLIVSSKKKLIAGTHAPDKALFFFSWKVQIFSLFLHENSLGVLLGSSSYNIYFHGEVRIPPLIWSYEYFKAPDKCSVFLYIDHVICLMVNFIEAGATYGLLSGVGIDGVVIGVSNVMSVYLSLFLKKLRFLV